MLKPVERRLLHAIKTGMQRGLKPRSIYLAPTDYKLLGRTFVADLPVRQTKNSSKVYFAHGIAVALPRRAQA